MPELPPVIMTVKPFIFEEPGHVATPHSLAEKQKTKIFSADFKMKKKRALVSCACTRCSQLKKKCDGTVPCSRCVEAQKEKDCALAVQQKRGPKAKLAVVQDEGEKSEVCLPGSSHVNTTFLLSMLLATDLIRNPQFRPSDLARCFNVELGADHVTVDLSRLDFSAFLPSVLSSPVVSQNGADLFGQVVGRQIAEVFADKYPLDETLRVFGAMFSPAAAAARRAHIKSFSFAHSKSYYGALLSTTITCRSKSHILFDETGVPKLLFVSLSDFFEPPIFADVDYFPDVDNMFDLEFL